MERVGPGDMWACQGGKWWAWWQEPNTQSLTYWERGSNTDLKWKMSMIRCIKERKEYQRLSLLLLFLYLNVLCNEGDVCFSFFSFSLFFFFSKNYILTTLLFISGLFILELSRNLSLSFMLRHLIFFFLYYAFTVIVWDRRTNMKRILWKNITGIKTTHRLEGTQQRYLIVYVIFSNSEVNLA